MDRDPTGGGKARRVREDDERQRLNDALLKAAQEWRATFDAMGDPVALLDASVRLQRCNRALAKLLDKSFDEILGRSCWELLFKHTPPLDWAEFEKRHRAGRGSPTVVKYGGNWFELWMDPMPHGEGDAGGYVYVMADVTRRELARRETQRLLKRLRTLHQIDRAILDLFSAERIACDALNHMRELVPFCCASVLMLDAEADASAPFALIGSELPAEYTRRVPGDPEIASFLRRGRPFYVEDVRALGPLPHAVKAMNDPRVRAFMAVPLLVNRQLVGTVNLGAESAELCNPDHIEIVREVAASLAVSLQNARLLQSVTRQQEQIRAANARMAEVEESERKRLACELHDCVGQNLTAIGIHLNHARDRLSAEPSANVAPRLDDALALLEELTETIRGVMTELRPALLDDYGLHAALKGYSETYAKRTGIRVVASGALKTRLPISAETILFRMAQELMTNVAKHAQAGAVYVKLEEDAGTVKLSVADDGIGFDAGSRGRPQGPTGWGLVMLRERAGALGGRFKLDSTPGEGTRAVITVERSKLDAGGHAEPGNSGGK